MKKEVSIICITGGIGAGKSIVSRILRQRGLKVYDCDFEAKRIMDSSPLIIEALKLKYGKMVINDGIIDRKALGDIIFSDKDERLWLNNIVHNAVKADILGQCSTFPVQPFFVETAIPYTAGFTEMCSYFWLVKAPEMLRVERIKKRNSLSEKDILVRIESQRKEFDILPDSRTFTIKNNESEALLPQIESLLSVDY